MTLSAKLLVLLWRLVASLFLYRQFATLAAFPQVPVALLGSLAGGVFLVNALLSMAAPRRVTVLAANVLAAWGAWRAIVLPALRLAVPPATSAYFRREYLWPGGVFLLAGCYLWLWFQAAAAAVRPLRAEQITNLFDRTIAVLTLGVLLSIVAAVGGVSPFFLLFWFLLAAVVLVTVRAGRTGRHVTGPLLLLTFLTVSLPLALLSWLPYPAQLAASGVVAAARSWLAPLGRLLTRLLIFLFAHTHMIPVSGSKVGSAAAPAPAVVANGATEVVPRFLLWGLLALVVLALGVLLLWVVSFLWRWLWQRPGVGAPSARFSLRALGAALKAIWQRVVGKLRAVGAKLALGRAQRRAPLSWQAFRYLERWGRKRGLPRAVAETPHQYGMRLAASYPASAAAIRHVTDSFAAARYGLSAPSPAAEKHLRAALAHLRRTPALPCRGRA